MPNLPTDNLYKFIAVFGLILMAISCYYGHIWEEKSYDFLTIHQQKYDTNFREKYKIEETIVENSIAQFISDWGTKEELLKDPKEYANEIKEFQTLEDWKREIDSVKTNHNIEFEYIPKFNVHNSEELNQNFKNLLIKYDKIEAERYALDKKEIGALDTFKTVLKRCIYIFIFGSVLMIIGFILWYYKYQKYLDLELSEKGKKNSFVSKQNFPKDNPTEVNNNKEVDEKK